jgi:hypothetical protein
VKHIKRTGSSTHAIARLAERQHGVVSRGQLRALGLSETEITSRVASGYLQPLFRETFAVGHRLIGRRGHMLAAVLACGEGTVLSHGSAAELLGLWDIQQVPIHVIPQDWSGRKIEGIRWHRVLRPIPEEVEIRDEIPCTTPARTLVDMAWHSGWKSMRQLVEQAAVLRVLDVPEVDRVLARGRRRGAPRLRAVLASWRSQDGQRPHLRSILEARLLPLLSGASLPPPRCNAPLRIDGHRLEVDMLWEAQRLVIETDGEQTHGTRAAFQRDRWRDQLLVAAGYRTARVTWRQIEDEPQAVIARIRRMLEQA